MRAGSLLAVLLRIEGVQHVAQLSDEEVRLLGTAGAVRIADLPVGVRARGSLQKLGIKTVADLVRLDARRLLRNPNFGWRSLIELHEALARLGVDWGGLEPQNFVEAFLAAAKSTLPKEVYGSVSTAALAILERQRGRRLTETRQRLASSSARRASAEARAQVVHSAKLLAH